MISGGAFAIAALSAIIGFYMLVSFYSSHKMDLPTIIIAQIIADKYFDERMVFTLIIMVIILLILTPVGIAVDKKIEAYFENKIES